MPTARQQSHAHLQLRLAASRDQSHQATRG
jgi:hypothetical protein